MEETTVRVYDDTRDAVNDLARILEDLGYGKTSQDQAVRVALSAIVELLEEERVIRTRTTKEIRDFLSRLVEQGLELAAIVA